MDYIQSRGLNAGNERNELVSDDGNKFQLGGKHEKWIGFALFHFTIYST